MPEQTIVPEFDADLIRRYRRSLPRYTSYPTAPHFSEDVGATEYVDEVDRTNREGDGGPISLYVHLPFCRSLCYYCGCHMMVRSRPETVEGYLARLEREIDLLAARVHGDREVVQLHWGGGTPTYLTPAQIERLGGHLRRRFRIADDAEVSLEADPRGLTTEHLEAARSVGFNR
ncbi:MAG: radical SAM protein, partial [Rhodothermales bacterium]